MERGITEHRLTFVHFIKYRYKVHKILIVNLISVASTRGRRETASTNAESATDSSSIGEIMVMVSREEMKMLHKGVTN